MTDKTLVYDSIARLAWPKSRTIAASNSTVVHAISSRAVFSSLGDAYNNIRKMLEAESSFGHRPISKTLKDDFLFGISYGFSEWRVLLTELQL